MINMQYKSMAATANMIGIRQTDTIASIENCLAPPSACNRLLIEMSMVDIIFD